MSSTRKLFHVLGLSAFSTRWFFIADSGNWQRTMPILMACDTTSLLDASYRVSSRSNISILTSASPVKSKARSPMSCPA